jgi:hypothetical protein
MRVACALAALAAAPAAAQGTWGKPLRFRADGTFKIVEVSDVHFTLNSKCNDLSAAQQRYPCSDANATAFWRTLIAEEDPDLFLFTGDNVCGGCALGGGAAIDGLLADWAPGGANAHVPWLAVEGNHDGESGLNYAQVAAKLLTMPAGLNAPNAAWLGAPVFGNTNFALGVLGAEGTAAAAQPLLTLYAVDSNSYSTNAKVSGYGWVHLDQINWFANLSASVKAAAAAGGYAPPPALAFQHIPLPQHASWVAGGGAIVGQFHEAVCAPAVDTGLLAAYIESGDVKAVTVGHDHTNDFCTATPIDGSVTLCYDGHGSYGASGYGEADWPIRARVWHASKFGALIQTYKKLDALAGGALPPGAPTSVDLQTIYGTGLPLRAAASSQTAGNPACPPSYTAVDVDLNKDAGGSYSYICVERALDAAGALLLNISVAFGTAAAPPACPAGWTQSPGNLKEGTKSTVVEALCSRVGPAKVGELAVWDVVIAQGAGAACPAGYAASPDLSGGVGLHEVLCANFAAVTAADLSRLAAGAGAPLPRLPARAALTAERPRDKASRAAPPARRKPLERA